MLACGLRMWKWEGGFPKYFEGNMVLRGVILISCNIESQQVWEILAHNIKTCRHVTKSVESRNPVAYLWEHYILSRQSHFVFWHTCQQTREKRSLHQAFYPPVWDIHFTRLLTCVLMSETNNLCMQLPSRALRYFVCKVLHDHNVTSILGMRLTT